MAKQQKPQEVLCYIERIESRIGKNDNQFRFYFTDTSLLDRVVGEDWDVACSNVVQPPHDDYILSSYKIKTNKFDLELLSESEFYTYNDGADGIISLGYEILIAHTTKKRLVFSFGDTVEEVENKLFDREVIFEKEDY